MIGRRIRAIHATRIADKGTLLAGTEDGAIFAIDALAGEVEARTAAGGSPAVRFVENADGQADLVER